jgi:hypothetical protein
MSQVACSQTLSATSVSHFEHVRWAGALRIAPTKMSREDYAKVMSDLERPRGGAPAGRLFHAGYGEGEEHTFDVWESRESFEPYHRDLVGHMQAAGLDGGLLVEVQPIHGPRPD